MPFVKLDCGILNSTLWVDRSAREIFITALLMAEPREIVTELPQIAVGSLEFTGWSVPPGWYGFVEAAGPGIINRAGMDDARGPLYVKALEALARLGEPDPESRSHAFDGRRLVRVDGGFVVLNFVNYRDKDATTADRSKRWRERQKLKAATRVTVTPTRVIRHQAEAEAEAKKKEPPVQPPANSEARSARVFFRPGFRKDTDSFERFWGAYPRRVGKDAAWKVWALLRPSGDVLEAILAALETQKRGWTDPQFIPHPRTWLSQGRWKDDPVVTVQVRSVPVDRPDDRGHMPPCATMTECTARTLAEAKGQWTETL